MSGRDELEAFIARVESLRELNERTAKAAEKGVAAAARRTAAAGKAPDGQSWETLKDGGKALEGAPAAIHSSTKGNRVELTIGQPYVFHNRGGHSGKFHSPKRQILPASGEPVPAPMKEAISEAAAEVFGKAMGG